MPPFIRWVRSTRPRHGSRAVFFRGVSGQGSAGGDTGDMQKVRVTTISVGWRATGMLARSETRESPVIIRDASR
eukprot:6192875-Pyramimonas_sp.AAC.1